MRCYRIAAILNPTAYKDKLFLVQKGLLFSRERTFRFAEKPQKHLKNELEMQ